MSAVNFDPQVGDAMTRETVAGFQKSYQVCLPETATRPEEEEIRRLFRVPLMVALERQPGWFIQSADGCLVLAHRGIAPGEERATLWHEAAELRRAFLTRESSARMPIPAAPGMERGREENRRAGQVGGGVAGLVLGFFGSFIAFAAYFFNQKGPSRGYTILAFFPVMIGGLVVVRCGGHLGGTVPGRPHVSPSAGWRTAGEGRPGLGHCRRVHRLGDWSGRRNHAGDDHWQAGPERLVPANRLLFSTGSFCGSWWRRRPSRGAPMAKPADAAGRTGGCAAWLVRRRGRLASIESTVGCGSIDTICGLH